MDYTSYLAEGAVVKNTTEILRLRGGVSQGSDCDSNGVPGYMQDYCEDDDMDLIRARREVEDFPILIAGGGIPVKEGSNIHGLNIDEEGILSPRSAKVWLEEQEKLKLKNGVEAVLQSASGGIPLEKVTVEDYVSSDEETCKVTDLEALERNTLHRATKMAFASNKLEREELFSLRKKLQVVDYALKKRGLSLADLELEQIEGENLFNKGLKAKSTARDEFGLPSFSADAKEGTSGLKNSQGVERSFDNMGVILEDFPSLPKKKEDEPKGTKNETTKAQSGEPEEAKGVKKNWSSVLKSPPPVVNNVNFEFHPLPSGTKIVDPPLDVLQKGLEKFKFCLVGVFTRGPQSFTAVRNGAERIWGGKGLRNVYQKNETTFVFKFASLADKSAALARGTCYINGKPLLLSDWGVNAQEHLITEIPIWVKFSNIPECYWTVEGLSRIASVIGEPLSADALTSQIDMLPFAKICIKYSVGDELPNKIPVMALDLLGTKRLVEVLVEYDQKPLVCSGCKALGHVISVCPRTKRMWVQKEKNPPANEVNNKESAETIFPKEIDNVDAKPNMVNSPAMETGVVPNLIPSETNPNPGIIEEAATGENVGGWTKVERKRPPPSPTQSVEDSPPPLNTFKNLARVDEIDDKRGGVAKLSKSQKKKQRQRGTAGKSSPRST